MKKIIYLLSLLSLATTLSTATSPVKTKAIFDGPIPVCDPTSDPNCGGPPLA